MAGAQRTISDVMRDVMASLPEVEEFESHGFPTFRVRGKIFATYTINHHGDGRVALNLMAPRGAQAAFVKMRPRVYFVPPYVGPRGWLGIELDKGLDWGAVRDHVRDAYEMVAPPDLVRATAKEFRVRPPTRKFRPEERSTAFKAKLRERYCGSWRGFAVDCLRLNRAQGSVRRFGGSVRRRSSARTTTRGGCA